MTEHSQDFKIKGAEDHGLRCRRRGFRRGCASNVERDGSFMLPLAGLRRRRRAAARGLAHACLSTARRRGGGFACAPQRRVSEFPGPASCARAQALSVSYGFLFCSDAPMCSVSSLYPAWSRSRGIAPAAMPERDARPGSFGNQNLGQALALRAPQAAGAGSP